MYIYTVTVARVSIILVFISLSSPHSLLFSFYSYLSLRSISPSIQPHQHDQYRKENWNHDKRWHLGLVRPIMEGEARYYLDSSSTSSSAVGFLCRVKVSNSSAVEVSNSNADKDKSHWWWGLRVLIFCGVWIYCLDFLWGLDFLFGFFVGLWWLMMVGWWWWVGGWVDRWVW